MILVFHLEKRTTGVPHYLVQQLSAYRGLEIITELSEGMCLRDDGGFEVETMQKSEKKHVKVQIMT